MMTSEYPIRAVSRLTGLSIDTLRAWERRYQAITPRREGMGRSYTEADVKRLKLLAEAVRSGVSISQIATNSNDELEALNRRTKALAPEVATPPETSVRLELFERVQGGIERYDLVMAEQELNRLAAVLPIPRLLKEVVHPLMVHVGEGWEEGRYSVAQEHMASALLRNLLGALMRTYVRSDASKLLFATPSGEYHELGVLSAAMLAAGEGLTPVYLGPNTPSRDILQAADSLGVDAIVLGMKGSAGGELPFHTILEVARQRPEQTRLFVGGELGEDLRAQLERSGGEYLPDLQRFEACLREL